MASDKHENLKEMTRMKLEKIGYEVTSVPSKMKTIFAKKRYTLRDIGNPDLVAIKDDEILVIQVVVSSVNRFQLERYQKVGKVVLVFDFLRKGKFEIWGRNDLL